MLGARWFLLGVLALAAVGCQGEAPLPGATSWQEAADRATAATFRLLSHQGLFNKEGDPLYRPTQVVAFYIGNDEWVSVGSSNPDTLYALRQEGVGYDLVRLEDGRRPVTPIGYDQQTGIVLLRASGKGVPPLRFAAAIPPPCTPLRLAGYWDVLTVLDITNGWARAEARAKAWAEAWAEEQAAAGFPAACDPAVVPDLFGWEYDRGDVLTSGYAVPGTAGTALRGVITQKERPWVETGNPYLMLDRSGGMRWYQYLNGFWDGGPVINAAGAVVGVRPPWGYYVALAAPAVVDVLARIRAEAGGDN